MDKVALLGLEAREIKILEAQPVGGLDRQQEIPSDANITDFQRSEPTGLPWSDHHALLCSFGFGE